ncbi:MAG: tRNA (adenosine(37)-N6)-threonylcarbamoyltransferase complex dimerization subunit type 1 TsaB [Bdellovibrionota bacterium]|mgnify:CR=1 FL=1
MKLLAWDTSSKSGTLVALTWDQSENSGWDGVTLAGELTLNIELTHSEKLLFGIDRILSTANWHIDDVDLFGVGIGPGSFTGLRIGVTTARTLAHTLGKKLVGVSSLAILARPLALATTLLGDRSKKVITVATTTACKGELFALWGYATSVLNYNSKKCGVFEQVIHPEPLIHAIKKELQKHSTAFWAAVGEGRRSYQQTWTQLPSTSELKLNFPFADHIQPRYLGLLCWEAFQAGLATDPLSVLPQYLRASDAEIKLRAGLLPPGPTRGL